VRSVTGKKLRPKHYRGAEKRQMNKKHGLLRRFMLKNMNPIPPVDKKVVFSIEHPPKPQPSGYAKYRRFGFLDDFEQKKEFFH